MRNVSQVNGEPFQFLMSYEDEKENQADERSNEEEKTTEEPFRCAGAVHTVATLSRRQRRCPAGENSFQTSFQIFVVGNAATKRERTRQ